MKLENDVLKLEVINKGGEMNSLIFDNKEILYKGDGPYWTGKNPTLFPLISGPISKEYELDGKVYPIKNHGLIRYWDIKTIKDDGKEIILELKADDETLKQYPFKFTYQIKYRLDNNKVLINYEITNNGIKTMPFTFGLHPGFIVDNFDDATLYFEDDEEGLVCTNSKTKEFTPIKLGEYKNFINDVVKYQTIQLKDLKSRKVTLKQKDYDVVVDMSKFKYLALWTADPKANYMCIEPWLSMDNIKEAKHPFDKNEFELQELKPNETFKIDYYIELNKK